MFSAITTGASVLAGIAFDPTIRGILSTAVGVVVLMGSIYLLLATNLGNRLGFLLALTGCFGWMAVMGLSWWIYGNSGIEGSAAHWKVVEFNAGDTSQAATGVVRDLDLSLLPQDGDKPDYDGLTVMSEDDPDRFLELDDDFAEATDGWRFLPPSDPSRAEAEAVVNADLPECDRCPFEISEVGDYLFLGGFEVGGKEGLPADPSMLDRVWNRIEQTAQITHPKHYAVIQVQKVIEQEAEPGQAPPTPVADESQPVISVVMIRDVGDLRFPSAMITIGSALIFGLLCWLLHQRETLLEENLAEAEAAAKG